MDEGQLNSEIFAREVYALGCKYKVGPLPVVSRVITASLEVVITLVHTH